MSRKAGTKKVQKLYCVCKTDGEDGKFMAACDGCDGWFHPLCLGTTKPRIDHLTRAGLKFLCHECSRANGDELHKPISNDEVNFLLRDSLHRLNDTSFNPRTNPDKDPYVDLFLSGINTLFKGVDSQKNKTKVLIKYLISVNNEMKKTLGTMLSKGKLTPKYIFASNSFQYFEANIAPTLMDKKLLRSGGNTGKMTSETTATSSLSKLETDDSDKKKAAAIPLKRSLVSKRGAINSDEFLTEIPSRRRRKTSTDDSEQEIPPKSPNKKTLSKDSEKQPFSASSNTSTKKDAKNDSENSKKTISSALNSTNTGGTSKKDSDNSTLHKGQTDEKSLSDRTVWRGVIEKSVKTKFGTFNINGKLVSGREDDVKDIPSNIEFIGRLKTMSLMEYLRQLSSSSSRRYSILRIEPDLTESEIGYFNVVHKYFLDRQRSGSLKVAKTGAPEGSESEEIYLLPLGKDESLPEFLIDKKMSNGLPAKETLAKPFGKMFLIIVVKNSTFHKMK